MADAKSMHAVPPQLGRLGLGPGQCRDNSRLGLGPSQCRDNSKPLHALHNTGALTGLQPCHSGQPNLSPAAQSFVGHPPATYV